MGGGVHLTQKPVYFLSPNGELYHYGVKGMKWGMRKSDKFPIGQNYNTDPAIAGGGGFDEELTEEEAELDEAIDSAKRYIEAGKYWLNSRYSVRVVDALRGNVDYPTWEDAKKQVNHKYRHTDKKPLR